jgi:histidinol-phosphate/aromatic aminotransferase/cobyric acid decarboxylase-like protein
VSRIPPPGPHGGDGAAVAAALGLRPEDVLDLSASMNPAAPSPIPVLAGHLRGALSYPDPTVATAALADAIGVDADRVLLTNGGAEAIALLAAELSGHVIEPEFSLHPRGPGGPRWRSNPHNPMGTLAGAEETAGVWDEAFYPLAAGQWTRGDAGTPVVGSLTKLLACPGLRVGYVLADTDLIRRCRARQPAWSVNGLVCSALPELLAPVDLPAWTARIALLRSGLASMLAGFGLRAEPSDANWLLVPAPGLRDALAPHGVVVRDCTGFGLPGVVRIAVPDDDGQSRLEEALRAAVRDGTVVPA